MKYLLILLILLSSCAGQHIVHFGMQLETQSITQVPQQSQQQTVYK